MADVTDPAFRRIIARCGKPDVFWTEFVSADGLYHTREVQKISDKDNPLLKDLFFEKTEKPIVAQIFSSQPEMIEYASALVVELGFDGVDINMGCPHRAIEKQGAGAMLMKNPTRAKVLIQSAKKGTQGKIPVSVKTRIGYSKNELSTWLPILLEEAPAVITVHARTRKELSEVPAQWTYIKEAVTIRNMFDASRETLIIGNGDVKSIDEGRVKVSETGADGVMIGRGIFGNPWIFRGHVPTVQEKILILIEHCLAFEEVCTHKSFSIMKKHFGSYITGFKGAKELRIALYACENTKEVVATLQDAILRYTC